MVALADILTLPYEERKALYMAIGESLRPQVPSLEDRYRAVRLALESVTGHPLDLKSRTREATLERAVVAYQLLSEGFSTTKVGKVIGRNHATVIHARHLIEDIFLYSRLYSYEFHLWINFKKALQ